MKIKLLFISMACFLILSSCDKDDKDDKNKPEYAIRDPLPEFNESDIQLVVGESYSILNASEYTEGYELELTTSNTEAIIITRLPNRFIITAKKMGNAIVTLKIKFEYGNILEKKCNVTVTNGDADYIELKDTVKSLKEEELFQIKYNIISKNEKEKIVEYRSVRTNIATVSKDGLVLAISPGETYINVNVKGSNIVSRLKVIVSPMEVEDIQLSESSVIEKGSSHTLFAKVIPEKASKSVVWSSSDNSIATVSNGRITGINVGSCTIFASSKDEKIKKECRVEVTPEKTVIYASGKNVLEGEIFTIDYYITPSEAADTKVTMKSSDANVVSILSDGKLKANKIGRVMISITAVDGSCSASCYINVVDITSMIKLYFPSSAVLNINGFITGEIYSGIKNNSNKTIVLKKFEIIDSGTNRVVASTDDTSKLGSLPAGSETSLGGYINGIYKPIYIWNFQYNGVDYKVSHIYEK